MYVNVVKPQSSLVLQPDKSVKLNPGSEKPKEGEDFGGFVKGNSESQETRDKVVADQKDRADEAHDLTDHPLKGTQNGAKTHLSTSENSDSAEVIDETELQLTDVTQTPSAMLYEDFTSLDPNTGKSVRADDQLSKNSQHAVIVPGSTRFSEQESDVASFTSNYTSQNSTANTQENSAVSPPENGLGTQFSADLVKQPIPSEALGQVVASKMERLKNENSNTHSVAASKGSVPASTLSGNPPEALQVIAPTERSRFQSGQSELAKAPENPVGFVMEKGLNNNSAFFENTSGASGTEKKPVPGQDIAQLANSLSINSSFETPLSRAEVLVGTATHSTTEASTIRPEIVRNAASQAVEVFVRQPGRLVEVALKPEELGRVRLSLSTSDAGVTVVITSERPETLDLMRRHIDQLAQEFARLGYQNMDFQFGSESTGDEAQSRNAESDMNPNPMDQNETDIPHPPLLVSTGLDLRL